MEFSGTDDIEELIHRVEAETSFQVRDHLLQLFGICPECLNTLNDRGDK
jgi:Fe2+ or Zn2+ uptake regulation protein